MKTKYRIALAIVGLLILANVYVGYSYSIWIRNYEGEETNTIIAGCFTIQFEELTKSINLKNTYPTSDANALAKINPYKMKITNTCDTTDAGYAITLNTVKVASPAVKIDDSKVKVAIGVDADAPTQGALLNSMEVNTELAGINVKGELLTSYIINTGYVPKNSSKTFSIYMWIDENAGNEVMNQVLSAGIVVTSYSTKINTLENEIKSKITKTGTGVYESIQNDITEYRFAGPNPENYILWNNERYRLIGLVNTIEGSRVKIIKETSLNNNAAIDTNGSNNWVNSSLLSNYTSNYIPSLNLKAQETIDTVTWGIGSTSTYDTAENGSTVLWYNAERSEDAFSGNVATWNGQIGLMTPSDYGYATSGGETTDRATCLNAPLSSIADLSECTYNNWLHDDGQNEWLMTPSLSSGDKNFMIDNAGNIVERSVTEEHTNRPTIYLKPNITLTGGNGTSGNPYRIE